VVGVVGGRQHLRLIDVVHAEALQDLRLDEMPDARLGHHRDSDRGDDALDDVRVAHPRHPALRTNVGGHPFQRHYRDGAGSLRDSRLLRGDDVHDDAALEHLGHAALDPGRSRRCLVRLCGAVHERFLSFNHCDSTLVVGGKRVLR
jgi:hypothetical protein